MIRVEIIDASRPIVVVEREPGDNPGAWARLQEAMFRGVVGGSRDRLEIRVDVFLAELDVLREIRRLFREEIGLGTGIVGRLRELASDRTAREAALVAPAVDEGEVTAGLRVIGFDRVLKDFQTKNLVAISRLPHGADFSVPGSGKTSVALANFALSRSLGKVSKALVIAPIAAFAAWKEDARDCFSTPPTVAVHKGVGSRIAENVDILLTNYNRAAADYDRIREFVVTSPTHLILDEAHRAKRGSSGVHGRAVLDLAFAAKRRDILTGTPAPQGAHDLVALIRFLYPGQDHQILPPSAYVERDSRLPNVLEQVSTAIRKYFVRTTKSQLDLPPTRFVVVKQPMKPLQSAIYSALIGQYRSSFTLDTRDRRELDRLGKVVMYLLEAATNPLLLPSGSDIDDEIALQHPPLDADLSAQLMSMLQQYSQYESPWKYDKILELVAEASARRQKVIVWSSFVRNLKILHYQLAKYQPAIVHGGVPPEDSMSQSGALTREGEIERFKNDDACGVLLANPAACGEGISLHLWCHHAVYLDRTFNAGQFLQSQDRIHRLGLDRNVATTFTLLVSRNSIDESVDARLRAKVSALAALMNDPGLVQIALPGSDVPEDERPSTVDDAATIREHLEAMSVDAA